MTTKEILLKLKSQLEQSIAGNKPIRQRAIELGNHQAAADFKQQEVGLCLAIALINEELETIDDKEFARYL